jgi:hypothetical protein
MYNLCFYTVMKTPFLKEIDFLAWSAHNNKISTRHKPHSELSVARVTTCCALLPRRNTISCEGLNISRVWVGRHPFSRCGFASSQGLTLVHFSAQLERFFWGRGCAWGLCSPCSGGATGCLGCIGYFLVSDTAQVELRSGRV